MRPPPRIPLYHRLMMGAGLRRALVYVIAAVLIVVAGISAARLSMPADPYESVHVESASPGAARGDAQTEAVRWDSERGRGIVDVRESDGVVRRYYMENDRNDGMRVWGGEEAPADSNDGG
ncbi:MAG: hypothetical protein ACOC7J_03170 [Armatimonadota bacterium]